MNDRRLDSLRPHRRTVVTTAIGRRLSLGTGRSAVMGPQRCRLDVSRRVCPRLADRLGLGTDPNRDPGV